MHSSQLFDVHFTAHLIPTTARTTHTSYIDFCTIITLMTMTFCVYSSWNNILTKKGSFCGLTLLLFTFTVQSSQLILNRNCVNQPDFPNWLSHSPILVKLNQGKMATGKLWWTTNYSPSFQMLITSQAEKHQVRAIVWVYFLRITLSHKIKV